MGHLEDVPWEWSTAGIRQSYQMQKLQAKPLAVACGYLFWASSVEANAYQESLTLLPEMPVITERPTAAERESCGRKAAGRQRHVRK